jgi:hypothetical protein
LPIFGNNKYLSDSKREKYIKIEVVATKQACSWLDDERNWIDGEEKHRIENV